MSSPLHDFLQRLVRGASAPDPEAALSDAGMESWDVEPASIADTAERAGLADPRAGAVARMVTFPESYEPPVGYPDGWPVLPGHEAWFTEVVAGAEEMRILIWFGAGDAVAAVDAVRVQMDEAGWRYEPAPDGAAPGGPRHLGWFRLAGRHRLMSVGEYEGRDALLLTEARPDQLWPGGRGLSGS